MAGSLLAQVIPNPSFETDHYVHGVGYASQNGGSITGWVSTSPSIGLNLPTATPFVDNGVTPHGANVAFIQSAGSVPSSISTTLTGLTAGVVYEVSFRANCRTGPAVPSASWSLNGAAMVPFTASPVVGGGNPYYTVIGSFTATASTAAMVIGNESAGDSTLLVDDFRILAQRIPGKGWSVSRWAGDASSGISPTKTRWAFHFGVTTLTGVNGHAGIGLPGVNPSASNRFITTGLDTVLNSSVNHLTGSGGIGSAVMPQNSIHGSSPASITVQGLTVGGPELRVSLFGVGNEGAARSHIFSSGSDQRVIDENALGSGIGLRVDYSFTATAARTIVVPVGGGYSAVLTGTAMQSNGAFQLNFTSQTGVGFAVVAHTDLTAPVADWSFVGTSVESPAGSGNYQFTDPDAPNHPKRFYRVRAQRSPELTAAYFSRPDS